MLRWVTHTRFKLGYILVKFTGGLLFGCRFKRLIKLVAIRFFDFPIGSRENVVWLHSRIQGNISNKRRQYMIISDLSKLRVMRLNL